MTFFKSPRNYLAKKARQAVHYLDKNLEGAGLGIMLVLMITMPGALYAAPLLGLTTLSVALVASILFATITSGMAIAAFTGAAIQSKLREQFGYRSKNPNDPITKNNDLTPKAQNNGQRTHNVVSKRLEAAETRRTSPSAPIALPAALYVNKNQLSCRQRAELAVSKFIHFATGWVSTPSPATAPSNQNNHRNGPK